MSYHKYPSRNRNDYDNQSEPPKRTGAKAGSFVSKKGSAHGSKKEVKFVRGWNYSKRFGMRTFFCTPYSKTKSTKSDNGRVWENWMCTYQVEGKPSETISALYEPATGKVIIPDLSIIINPKARRGGYCGRAYSSRR